MFQNFAYSNNLSNNGQASSSYINAIYRTKYENDQWRNSPSWSSNATSNEEQEQPSLSSSSVTSGNSNTATPTSTANTQSNNSSTNQLANSNQNSVNNAFGFSNSQNLPSKLQVCIQNFYFFLNFIFPILSPI